MYQVSNKDMEDIIKYVEAYRLSVDVKTCDIKRPFCATDVITE